MAGLSNGANNLPKEVTMAKKSFFVILLICCLGIIMTGCPKKTVVREEPSVKKEEAAKREREEAVKREEAARREEAAKREEVAIREEAAKREEVAKKEFEKSIVAKREPGVEGVVFESSLLKDIHFDFDKYDIRPGDAAILKENAALLKKYPNVKIQIEGHCDERGTNEYNLALGERRANSTKSYLLSLGVSTDRLSAISYGEEKPLDPGHNEEAWAKNRRAHFIITSK
jgi:peptidoglycan-associated lipoprotein